MEGYTLVLTKEHVECCASIPATLVAEFSQVVSTVARAQRDIYGSFILYEHGRTGGCLVDSEGEPHCYHAHLHCVPVVVDMASVLRDQFQSHDFDSWESLIKWYQTCHVPYLLMGDESKLTCFEVDQPIPRQYLRKLAAGAVGAPSLADWQTYQGRDKISVAKEKLGPSIRECYSTEFA